MNPLSAQLALGVALLCVFASVAVSAMKPLPSQKGAPENYDSGPVATYGSENEVLSKIEAQLFGALQLLQAYEEAAPMPLKFAEKRRNKFEFIRFGRRRRWTLNTIIVYFQWKLHYFLRVFGAKYSCMSFSTILRLQDVDNKFFLKVTAC